METEIGCALGQIEHLIRYAVWSSGSSGIVIGLSGGIDSAVSATLCCRAMGGDRVLGLILPAAISRAEDAEDAILLCNQLGMEQRTININPILAVYRTMPDFSDKERPVGNLMSRIRMTILYYHANLRNMLVCGTSNKSEYLLGYFTKYGDGAADIEPILHFYKTEICSIAGDLNIPESILKKTPSAGLWRGQTDETELGLTYKEIDTALRSLEQQGWKSTSPLEEQVLSMVQKTEHKRISPPSLFSLCRP